MSNASLDDSDVQHVEMWTFYSTEGKEKFTVTQQVAKLSGVFTDMIEHSQNEKAASFSVVNQKAETDDSIYQINTDALLRYVYKYLKLWEEHPDKANYVKVEPVQTSEISHVLKPVDINYIEEYLSDNMPKNVQLTISELRRKKIECLSILLSQVDEFLDIASLSNKIYAYIAVLIWNTSAVDFADAMRDVEFKKAQEAAVEAWRKDNPTKFANYIRSHTTDGVSLAPAIADNADIAELEDLSLEAENAALNDGDSDSEDADSDSDEDADDDS